VTSKAGAGYASRSKTGGEDPTGDPPPEGRVSAGNPHRIHTYKGLGLGVLRALLIVSVHSQVLTLSGDTDDCLIVLKGFKVPCAPK